MSLKNKLKNNQLTIGSWITIGNSSVIEIMATAGFEWLCIDMEHTSIDLATAKMLITTIHANNIKALVRVSKNEEVAIKKVMDMGADGVIVPMIKSKKDAQMAIDFVKYPPTGKRGVGLYRAQNYGIGFEFRTISDEDGDIGDSIVFYLPTKEKAQEFAKRMAEEGLGTKNLPDAIKWHFAKHWQHMFKEYDFYNDGINHWKKSDDILSCSIALPVMVKIRDEQIDTITKKLLYIAKEI